MTRIGLNDPTSAAHRPACHSSGAAPAQQEPYWLYLLECEGGVYYAGIALDVERRFVQHVLGTGAKFTRARPPRRVLAARLFRSKGEALRAELQLKALPRDRKLGFFELKERADVCERQEEDESPGARPRSRG